MKYIVTTSLRMNEELVAEARQLAEELAIPYQDRQKRSVARLLAEAEAVLVVYRERLVLEQEGRSLFFHPDTAMLRIKAGRDPLLDLIGKEPQQILDCTMGLATDSIVMACAGHQVLALESSQLIYKLVSRGLQEFDSGHTELNRAMQSIATRWTDSLSFLQEQSDHSFDIIYFDPMFSETIKESANLAGLIDLADYSRLTEELLQEAKRVARKKVILKAHFRDDSFERLGFIRHVRPNQKFHYGEIVL